MTKEKTKMDLTHLKAGDVIVGGTFMEGLDPAEVEWTILSDYSHNTRDVKASAKWLGVDLGTFCISTKKVVPWN